MDARAAVLVPGLMPQTGAWRAFERQLRRRGWEHVAVVTDLVWTCPIHDLAEHLSRHIDVLRATTGVDQVELVGHNFGGMLVRYYAQLLDTDEVTSTVITVGTPHRGTTTPIEVGALSGQLRPESALIDGLHRVPPPTGVNWINYVSPEALLVDPAALGVFHGPGFTVANIVVTRQGDLSLHLPRVVRDSMIHRLEGGGEAGDPIMEVSQAARFVVSKAHHPSSHPRSPRE